MKESNARLQGLPSSSLELKSEDLLTTDDGRRSGDLSNIKQQTDSVSQSSAVEASKNGQHFETIRDPHKSMLRLIDTMFDHLQLIADEINKTNTDPQLNLHWQRPTLEKIKTTTSWLKTSPELPSFTGKIYTYDWSLIIKGTTELITSYVIPSDRVISFNTEPEIYSPYLSINFIRKGAVANWQIDNEVITHEHMPELAQRLLERLLKSARSQEWSQSVFCLQAANVAGENQPESNPVDPEQFLIELMKNAAEQAQPKVDEFKIVPESLPAPQIPAQVASVESRPVEIESKAENPISMDSFDQVFKSLPDVIVHKLEQLTKEGGEAFARRDLKGAQDILTLSNELNDFKNKAEEIMAAFKIQR